MKASIIPLLIILLLIQSVDAQNHTHEFGKYSKEDFDLTACPYEPDAEAVVLYDIGKTSFGSEVGGYNIYFQHTFKIKILTKAGIKHAEFSIPLYQGDNGAERLETIKANTYNYENGSVKVTSLNPKETYTQKINDRWILKKFAIPDVKEGSVFDVHYVTNSPYIFNFNDWEFQRDIPVLYSEYTAVMIPTVEYVYSLQGASKFDEFKTYTIHNGAKQIVGPNNDDMAYLFIMRNLPSIKEDDFMSTIEDYRIKLNFQLAGYASSQGAVVKVMTTWEQLIKDLLSNGDFGRYLRSGKGKAEELIETMELPSAPLEKAKYLRTWITNNFRFNGINSPLAKSSVKTFFETKVGNSAEINLFYIALLRAAGFYADPVIISTRDNGKVNTSYPFIDAFNYVMVTFNSNGKIYLIDATEQLYRFDEIPPRCLNEKGLIVNDDQTEWMTFSSTVTSKIQYNQELTIFPSESKMLQKCDVEFTGYEAARYRSKFNKDYEDLKKEMIHLNVTADSLKSKNLNLIDLPFELSFNEELPLESADGKIIIDPFLGRAINENPFKQPARTYPIDFNYKRTRSFETIIHIPEGYNVLTKPDNLIVNNPTARIIYTVDDQTPGLLKVTALYEFKKDVYPAEFYKDLKGYFNMIVNKLNEKIILGEKVI
jgi:hypothetical protein